MEALLAQLLLTLGLAFLALLAFFRSTTAKQSRAPAQRDIIVRDPAIVQRTLVEHADAFTNRPAAIFPTGLQETHSINSVPYGPMWRALRGNLTTEILHPTRLHLLAALQQEAAAALVADLSARVRRGAAAGGEVMVVRDILHASMFALSARVCFGDDGVGERYLPAIERELVQFAYTFVQDLDLFKGSSWMTKLRHWRRWLRWSGSLPRLYKVIQPIIAARRQSRRTSTTDGGIRSYIDSLLDLKFPDSDSDDTNGSKQHRSLTDREIVRLAFEFISVSTESPMACVEWTLAHLAMDPEVQNKLHREITSGLQQDNGKVVSEERLHRRLPYLRAVMLESLRLHPPVPWVLRHVSAEDAAIAKAQAAASSTHSMPATIVMDIHKIGRNNKLWTDPQEFRPERFLPGGEAEGVGPLPGPKDIRMVPFGAGRRYCPGVELGMIRVGCILTALVCDFEWSVPADGNSIDLKPSIEFFTMMKTPLRVRVTPRTLSTM